MLGSVASTMILVGIYPKLISDINNMGLLRLLWPLLLFMPLHVEEHYRTILDQYPFLSFVSYGGNDYIGVIQNADDVVTTIYDYSSIKDPLQRARYIELAEQWWMESNRQVPINLFLKQDWAEFKSCIKVLNSKNVEVKHGPNVCLADIGAKKSKRKSITLVRRVG
jgi:hypothetical protein